MITRSELLKAQESLRIADEDKQIAYALAGISEALLAASTDYTATKAEILNVHLSDAPKRVFNAIIDEIICAGYSKYEFRDNADMLIIYF